MTLQDTAPRRWVPSPLLSASAALHLGAGAAVLINPRHWPWALGAIVANHVLLAAAGLWPRSQLLGPNWIRLPAGSVARNEVAITIDDGPDPDVTPQVLSQLAQHHAPATFFCVGERVQRYPELAREILRGGHAIENHSQRHLHTFSLLGPGGIAAEISRAQESIQRATGDSPRFFRAPAGAAQSVSGTGVDSATDASRELDSARLRYRQRRGRCGVPAIDTSLAKRRHPAAA